MDWQQCVLVSVKEYLLLLKTPIKRRNIILNKRPKKPPLREVLILSAIAAQTHLMKKRNFC